MKSRLTEKESKEILNGILDTLGIKEGDNLLLGVNLGKVALPFYSAELNIIQLRIRERKWCDFLLELLKKRIGKHGTLLIPVFTYSSTRPGFVFDYTESVSEVGPFSEYFRLQPKVIRSNHPIFSVAGFGLLASDILTHVGQSAFGFGSPFDRMNRYPFKFLTLGTDIKNGLTYLHHLEQRNGCVHRFNKQFDVLVQDENSLVSKKCSAFLNYRGLGYESDFSSFQLEAKRREVLKEAFYNNGVYHCIDLESVNEIGNFQLTNNQHVYTTLNDFQLFFSDQPDEFFEGSILKITKNEVF
jgi:aminoglycoside N3'-acetyltransferase